VSAKGMDDLREHLKIALSAAVPLRIWEMRDWSERRRIEETRGVADVIGCEGDLLMFGGKRGETARVFNALAKGVAAAAYQPGGITFLGVHWCVNHALCEQAVAAAVADVPEPEPSRLWRRVVDLELPYE
jgi:hypothetical protein